MNTHETYVSFETTKMLNKAGFNWASEEYYCSFTGELRKKPLDRVLGGGFGGYAPSLGVAQKWLREVKDICVNVENVRGHYGSQREMHLFIYEIIVPDNDGDGMVTTRSDKYPTYEAALEAGIQKCLTMLTEQK